MNQHRIFIAINLPEDIKNKLAEYQEKWPELPAKWTKKYNIHITLVFLGYVATEELPGILESVKKVAAKNNSFLINLTKISYGPLGKMPPRIIWAIGEKSEELGKLQNDLENSIGGQCIGKKENRSYSERSEEQGSAERSKAGSYVPHLTLARIKAWEFNRIEPEEIPQIEEEISFNFEVNSIEIMESQLKKGGPSYTILESIPLQ